VIISEPAWLIDLSRKTFTPAEQYPEDIAWHESVFAGYGEGITDRGGPVALTELKRLYEVDKIHALAKQDPNYFFNTPASVWAHTGRVGKAPDFIGFSTPNIVRVAEIKWQHGWDPRLAEQMHRYISDSVWAGNTADKQLVVHIACPQTASRNLINSVIRLPNRYWQSLEISFGFMQLGWLRSNQNKTYLRVVWVNGTDWNGEQFEGCPHMVGLHGQGNPLTNAADA
jgi:hypothetical protein